MNKVKTVRVKEDTWRELMILKYKLKKRDMNEVMKYLLECYQQREAVRSE